MRISDWSSDVCSSDLDYSKAGAYGRHGAMWYVSEGALPYRRSSRLPPQPEPDIREHIIGVTTEFHNELGAMASGRAYRAFHRLKTDIPADASPSEVLDRKSTRLNSSH